MINYFINTTVLMRLYSELNAKLQSLWLQNPGRKFNIWIPCLKESAYSQALHAQMCPAKENMQDFFRNAGPRRSENIANFIQGKTSGVAFESQTAPSSSITCMFRRQSIKNSDPQRQTGFCSNCNSLLDLICTDYHILHFPQ